MIYDITFCRSKCDKTDCFRHKSKIPRNTWISVAYLKGSRDCPLIDRKNEEFIEKEVDDD